MIETPSTISSGTAEGVRQPAAPVMRPQQSVGLLLIAIWFGLLAGFAEAAIRIVAKVASSRTVHFDPNLLWLSPLANVLLMLIPALVIVAVSRALRPKTAVFAVITAAAALLFMTLLFTYPRLHPLANVALAMGLAVQLARLLASRETGFRRTVGQTLPLLALLGLGSAIGVQVRDRVNEGRALSRLAPAPAGSPNILLVILDTVRCLDVSVCGSDRPTTPNLAKLASQSVKFERTFATAPWTLASHASMFTGRYPHELSANWQTALDRTYPTLAEVLRDRGYSTAGFNANRFYGGAEFGLGRGFIHYEAYPLSISQMIASSALARYLVGLVNRQFDTYYIPGSKPAPLISRGLLRWLGRDRDRPFFAFLNYFDAHEPYAPPAPFDMKFNPAKPVTRRVLTGQHHTALQVRDLRYSYDDAIAYTDAQVGALLGELQRRGVLENTIVIVTSDHGEEFSEHGYMSHGNGLYIQSLHVPLIISLPGQKATGPRVVEQPITLRDLPATVLDLAGMRGDARIPGHSLVPLWSGAAPATVVTSPLLSEVRYVRNQPDWYPVAHGDMRSIIVGNYHYVVNGTGREELYDIANDAAEQNNLASSPNYTETMTELRSRLNAAVGSK